MKNGSQGPEAPVVSTDLVPVAPGCESRMSPMPRPLAGFLAHLLACRDQVPAYRARRRATPERALASYRGPAHAPRRSGYERRF
jgi:hypothetical protein